MEKPTNKKFVALAKKEGMLKDQVINLANGEYVPLPWQMKFHAASRIADITGKATKIAAGGARGPGKSHCVFAQVCLDDCARIPGLKALFLRQTGTAARESFEDLIMKVLVGKVNYVYNRAVNTLVFPNGSRVLLGGFHDERDIDKYIGIEYDLIAIEELNQLLKERVDKLLGSMRTSKIDWRPRLYTSFNPGGIGHAYVKQTFVDPFDQGTETDTMFIRSTYRDNPYLNREYIDYLEHLEGDLGRAWREGNFDLFEGQYFTKWSRDKHVINPISIPKTWKRYRSYDHGRAKPASMHWYTVDYDGNLYVYRELYVTGLNAEQIAKKIVDLSGDEVYEYSVADPSIFHKTGFVDQYGGETIAETFANNGVTFYPASNRRVDGWNLVHQYLEWDKTKEKYRLTTRKVI